MLDMGLEMGPDRKRDPRLDSGGLEADGLTKYYSAIPAVRGVSFSLRPGGVLGLLGPNGSGKSTTVSILAGLLEPSGGTVRLDGQDVREDLLGYKAQIGYVPEEAVLYTYLTGPGVPDPHRQPQGRPAGDPAGAHRRFHGALRTDRRHPCAFVGLFEGHAAENPDLGGAPAQPGNRDPRRAQLGPRRHDNARAAQPGPDARLRGADGRLQLTCARERRTCRDRRDHPQRRPCRRARFGLSLAGADGARRRSSRCSDNS